MFYGVGKLFYLFIFFLLFRAALTTVRFISVAPRRELWYTVFSIKKLYCAKKKTMIKLPNTARTLSQAFKIQAVVADSNSAFMCE